MGLIAAYETTFAHLPLVDVAAAVPETVLQVDVGQPNQGSLPPFFVRATGRTDGLERAFADSDFVAEFALVGHTADATRYQVVPAVTMTEQLGEHVDDVDRLRDLARNESVVEHIEVTPTGWRQTRWFADRNAFDEYRAFWQRNGGFRLRRLTRDGDERRDGEGDSLTDRQREAIRTAHEMGYFEIPRRAALEDVAAELGISASSLSERLRRAQSHLVTTHVSGAGRPDGS
jgi:hypothetical protein